MEEQRKLGANINTLRRSRCEHGGVGFGVPEAVLIFIFGANRPYKETSGVSSQRYRANTLLRIHFSAGVITNTSSNIPLYTVFAVHLLGMRPNMTYLWY